MALILGIESSCDETAAAVVEDGRLVRSSVIASQHELHRKYAGVVPEIASRAHLEQISPVLGEALAGAGVELPQIDAVAVGNRPGLIGSLLVGVSAAKALAWALGRPLVGIDHVQAHLYAASLVRDGSGTPENKGGVTSGQGPVASKESAKPALTSAFSTQHSALINSPAYPALGLVVSGGHTSLYDVAGPTQMQLLGKTIDDAVGEAYDKAAVILDVGYPGGPRLDKLAQQGDAQRAAAEGGDLPRSLLAPDSLDFSYSGLKTALLYRVRGNPRGRGDQTTFARSAADLTPQAKADLAALFQRAAIQTLIVKMERAIDRMEHQGRRPRSLLIGGGVSAISLLRRLTTELGQKRGIAVHLPAMEFCLDNAAMIAGLAFDHWRQRRFHDLDLPVIATAQY